MPEKLAVAVAITAIAAAPIVALAGNISYNNRSRYYIAQDYVENILSTIEPGGMLLTSDWQVYSPALYMREIEHRRKDVIAIDINQLRRSWYYDYLNQTYPQMMEAARDKVEAFLADLKHWEHDPEIYDRDITLNQRINTGFYDMILAFVTNHIGSAPVYTTLDIAINFEGQNSDLTKSLTKSYEFVPQGLVFQLMSKGEYHAPAEPQLITRGLADGSLRFADDDVVKLKVLPVYVRMLTARGRYLADQGRHEQAIEAYKQALALDPDFKRAQQFLIESTNALRKSEPRSQP